MVFFLLKLLFRSSYIIYGTESCKSTSLFWEKKCQQTILSGWYMFSSNKYTCNHPPKDHDSYQKFFQINPLHSHYYDPFSEYGPYYISDYIPAFFCVQTSIRLLQSMSSVFFQLGFLYFVPLHLLDLINTITTVNSTSAVYAEQKAITIREMLYRLMEGKQFKGPLITSICVLYLNSIVLFGLIWAITNSIIPSLGTLFVVVYGIFSVVLLVKWIEWSALWNMAIVFSVLEERHGLVALGISGYFSRVNKRRGLYLMSIFFVWRAVLRLSFVYVGGHEKWVALAATSVLSCTGNVMKWVVSTIYFYDSKKRVLEKKVDVEEETKVDTKDMGLA